MGKPPVNTTRRQTKSTAAQQRHSSSLLKNSIGSRNRQKQQSATSSIKKQNPSEIQHMQRTNNANQRYTQTNEKQRLHKTNKGVNHSSSATYEEESSNRRLRPAPPPPVQSAKIDTQIGDNVSPLTSSEVQNIEIRHYENRKQPNTSITTPNSNTLIPPNEPRSFVQTFADRSVTSATKSELSKHAKKKIRSKPYNTAVKSTREANEKNSRNNFSSTTAASIGAVNERTAGLSEPVLDENDYKSVGQPAMQNNFTSFTSASIGAVNEETSGFSVSTPDENGNKNVKQLAIQMEQNNVSSFTSASIGAGNEETSGFSVSTPDEKGNKNVKQLAIPMEQNNFSTFTSASIGAVNEQTSELSKTLLDENVYKSVRQPVIQNNFSSFTSASTGAVNEETSGFSVSTPDENGNKNVKQLAIQMEQNNVSSFTSASIGAVNEQTKGLSKPSLDENDYKSVRQPAIQDNFPSSTSASIGAVNEQTSDENDFKSVSDFVTPPLILNDESSVMPPTNKREPVTTAPEADSKIQIRDDTVAITTSITEPCEPQIPLEDNYSYTVAEQPPTPSVIATSDCESAPVPTELKTETMDEEVLKISNEISSIESKVDTFAELAQHFSGTVDSPDYYYIDENLTRLLLSLDKLDADVSESLRLQRRAVIKYIYMTLGNLEKKASDQEL